MRKIALALLLASSTSYAEISITPGFSLLNVSYDNEFFTYDEGGIAVDVTIAADNGYYFNGEVSQDGNEALTRDTTTLTVGKSFTDLNLVAFVGLRNASTSGHEEGVSDNDQIDVRFEINGGFIGASKRFMVSDQSALSLSAAIGSMSADLELEPANQAIISESADSTGYSAGAAYSSWFSNGIALTAGAKYQRYAFDFEGSDGETVSILYGKISYRL